jgi:hypothetical protein
MNGLSLTSCSLSGRSRGRIEAIMTRPLTHDELDRMAREYLYSNGSPRRSRRMMDPSEYLACLFHEVTETTPGDLCTNAELLTEELSFYNLDALDCVIHALDESLRTAVFRIDRDTVLFSD